jgi:type VI secretion system protein VasD
VVSVSLDDNRIAIVEETRDDSGATPHKQLRNDRSSQ